MKSIVGIVLVLELGSCGPMPAEHIEHALRTKSLSRLIQLGGKADGSTGGNIGMVPPERLVENIAPLIESQGAQEWLSGAPNMASLKLCHDCSTAVAGVSVPL